MIGDILLVLVGMVLTGVCIFPSVYVVAACMLSSQISYTEEVYIWQHDLQSQYQVV